MPRLTTPVRKQPAGDERCIAYAVAAAMETSICRNRVSVAGVPEISVDDLFHEGGREVGAIDGIQFAVEQGGVVTVDCFPPAVQGRCAAPAPHLWKCRIRPIGGKKKNRVELMRSELRTSGPLVALMEVFSNFPAFIGDGVYDAVKPSVGFHAVCIIGDEPDVAGTSGFWIAKNSMGSGWGDAGFGRFRWNDPLVRLEDIVFVVENVRQ